MKLRPIIAIIAAVVLLVSSGVSFIISATEEDTTQPISCDEFTNNENQLFTFELENWENGEYRLKNVNTEQYLSWLETDEVIFSSGEGNSVWYLTGTVDGYRLMTSDNKYLIIEEINGNAVFKLKQAALSSDESSLFTLENINSEKREFLPSATYALKFEKQILGKNVYLKDGGAPVYTVSKYSDTLTDGGSQKWVISYSHTFKGDKYFTLVNAYTGKYLFDDGSQPNGSEVCMTSNSNADGAMWKIVEVPYSEIPQECQVPNNYSHYYRFISKNGRTLLFDSQNEAVITNANAGNTPSCLTVINEGELYNNSPLVNIMFLGGDGSSNDVYDPGCLLYLKGVKGGNEFTFGMFWKNSMNNQKWELNYIDTQEAVDQDKIFGTDYFYYTIKSLSLNKYLTIKDGILTLEDYTGDYSQQWLIYDVAARYQNEDYKNYYWLSNRGCGWYIGLDFINGFYYDSPISNGGSFGAAWTLYNADNGKKTDLNHTDPENIVKNTTVMFNAMSSSMYLQVDGPDIAPENAIRKLYISADGDDANSGSQDSPIATVARANELLEENGVRKKAQILFRRGDVFDGRLSLAHLNGKKYNEVTISSYGDLLKPSPVIKSNGGTALYIEDCTYLIIKDIDFVSESEASNTALSDLIYIEKAIQISLSDCNLSALKPNNVTGIRIVSSGNSSDVSMQSICFDNLTFKNLSQGIVAKEVGGSTLKNSSFSEIKDNAVTLEDCSNLYIYGLSFDNCASNDFDSSAILISGSTVALEKLKIENIRSNSTIKFIGQSDKSGRLQLLNSTLRNINGNALTVITSSKADGVPIDSIMLDNIYVSDWGIGHKGYVYAYEGPVAESSINTYIVNSTFVKTDDQKSGSAVYNFANTVSNGVQEMNISSITSEEYAKLLQLLNRTVTVSALLPRGNTPASEWESFNSVLASSQDVYNSYYPTVFDINSAIESLNIAADLLDNSPGNVVPPVVETPQEEIPVEEPEDTVTLELIKQLIENADGDVNMHADEPFVLTKEMQQLFIESNKKLTVTFFTDDDKVLLQWIFPYFDASYDIDLGWNDLSNNAQVLELEKRGRVISTKHRDALPKGTKLIISNGFFKERKALELYYQYPDLGKFKLITEEFGSKRVYISDDMQYLQLTINSGGDFLVMESKAVNNSNTAEGNSINIKLLLMIGIPVFIVLCTVLAVFVFIKKRTSAKRS